MQTAGNREYIEQNKQNIATNKQQIEQNDKDIQENTDRFMALSEYDVKGQATVKFDVGSAKISAKDQIQLKELANTATRQTGYIVEVVGYADATGSAEVNTKLSEGVRGVFRRLPEPSWDRVLLCDDPRTLRRGEARRR